MTNKSSSFLKKQLEKMIDLNMADDVITLDLNKLKENKVKDKNA